MRGYSHLSDDEREQVGLLTVLGHSIGAIARALRRPKSTISRELSRNRLPSGRYSPLHAVGAYQLRRRREALIEKDRALRTFVLDRLAEGWTPEQIAGWLKAGNERRLRAVGWETIDESHYLAINTGFPNSFDKANNRDGSSLMIHGDCSSSGCYAMTDEQMGEIYSLARDSLLGRPSFQIQAYPFRLTPANLARHRTNPNLAFWKMLKIGNDHFEATHLEPKVDVCDRRYVFDAKPPPNSPNPLVFDPIGKCPAFVVNPKIARPALEKQRTDEVEYAQLLEDNVSAAPIYSGLDGGMNKVFLARFPGTVIPLAKVMPYASQLPQLPPIPWVDNDGSLGLVPCSDRHGHCGTHGYAEARYHGWAGFLRRTDGRLSQRSTPAQAANFDDVTRNVAPGAKNCCAVGNFSLLRRSTALMRAKIRNRIEKAALAKHDRTLTVARTHRARCCKE